jgi:7-cyano-7-deazaguanine synthase
MALQESALVLFSGGQDSTACLGWALSQYDSVETIGFDYGQRHAVELECRKTILETIESVSTWHGSLSEDHMIDLGVLGEISETALTRETAITMDDSGLPSTFVPGRNLAFLVFAAAIAYRRGIRNIVTGVCQTDYSGYPDCRDDAMKAMQLALNTGMASSFIIHTPLMLLTKAQTWATTKTLGGEPFVEYVSESTHTCYMGTRDKRHAWGYGCGECPACELRARGYAEFRVQS